MMKYLTNFCRVIDCSVNRGSFMKLKIKFQRQKFRKQGIEKSCYIWKLSLVFMSDDVIFKQQIQQIKVYYQFCKRILIIFKTCTELKMKNQISEEYLRNLSWLDCIGDFQKIKNKNLNDTNSMKDYFPIKDPFFEKPRYNLQSKRQFSTSKLMTTDSSQNQMERITEQDKLKRPSISIDFKQNQFSSQKISFENNISNEQQQDQKSSQKQEKNQGKLDKRSIYSKIYRQRKKEKLKILQEQNNFLKDKINELQFRLRQKELQINRLKYLNVEKQCSIEDLNREFLTKTNIFVTKAEIDPLNYAKKILTAEDISYPQFVASYDENGFGGRRKKNILNYYFNQMLQALMMDSQKYLFLLFNKSHDTLPLKGMQEYQLVNVKFAQIMVLDQQKMKRLDYFTVNLRPFIIELKNSFTQIFSDFNKINLIIDRIHNFMKESYLQNYDFAVKRIQFENWFFTQKHSKMMRRLRAQWLELIKSQTQSQIQQTKKNCKGYKKKKIISQQNLVSN